MRAVAWGGRAEPARVLAGAVLALMLLVSTPAAAHTGGAKMEVRTAGADEELAIDISVDVTYEGDGEPAEQAFVTITPRDDTGRRLDPIELDRTNGGRYLGTIELDQPGRWLLDITSAFPPGQTTAAVDVGGSASSGAGAIIAASGAIALTLVAVVVWRRRRSTRLVS